MIQAQVDIRRYESFMAESLKQIKDPKHRKIAVRGYALKFIEEVVPITPVDTGRARSSWTAGLRRLGGGTGVRIGGSDRAMQEVGRREGKYSERGLNRPGDNWSASVFSGAPHIVMLELGSSMQAPQGMVRVVLRKMAPKVAQGEKKRVHAAFRVANIKARREFGMKQGGPMRSSTGSRANLLRR